MTPRRGKVWLVGAGPGDPGLLTLKAARAIANADVLVYDYLAAAPVVALAPPGCQRIYVGKKSKEHTMPQSEISALIVKLGREGKNVVRLKGGDPFVFGRGGEEAQELFEAGVPFEIVPGITSAIAAPAYAGIPVTHRNHNTAFTIATGHEDPSKGNSTLDFARLADPHQTLVFLMAMGNLAGIVAKLLENGLPPDRAVAIVREGTKPAQETLVATLGTIVAEVERTRFAAPAIVVIGDVVNEREQIRWFDRTPLFGKRILLTRPDHASDDLAIRLWELGAEPVIAPAIAVEPPDDPARARRAVEEIRTYGWVVFTSRNGVAAFFDVLGARGEDARAFSGAKIAAIGPKTAEALTKHGIRPDFVPAKFVGEEVASGLVARVRPGERVLLFRAQEARDVIRDALRGAGCAVDAVAAYKTVIVRDEQLAGHAAACDVWTFSSAGAVAGFMFNVRDAVALSNRKIIACIGPITAQAAVMAGLRVDVVAREATADALIDAVEAHAAGA